MEADKGRELVTVASLWQWRQEKIWLQHGARILHLLR